MSITFYDTNLFLHSLNSAHPEHSACGKLLDPLLIVWPVVFSDLSRTEATIGEYIEAFVVACAGQGIRLQEITHGEVKTELKKQKQFVQKLKVLGLGANDCRQVCAATVGAAKIFATSDLDFQDPALKSTKKKKKNGNGSVSTFLETTFGFRVLVPSKALLKLLP